MKCERSLILAILLVANCYLVFAQTEPPQSNPNPTLHNADILRMHNRGAKAGVIISKIVTSSCNFDTFPPVLRDLKRRGIPDTVLMAMTMVPYGPPASTQKTANTIPGTARAQIPAGTVVEVEAASPISSADVRQGRRITFLVARQVAVDGVVVIARGAVARAHLVRSKRARAWGRSGALSWVLEDVIAVDGTRVPIKLSDSLEGKSRSKAVVAAAIATGAVVFPYSPPAGLIWALKKGDEAVLDRSRKSTALVTSNTDVEGLLPDAQKVIYHPVDQLKEVDSKRGIGLAPASDSFRPTSIRKN
jgi:hypothetical protein